MTDKLFRISAFPYNQDGPDGPDPAFDFDASIDYALWGSFTSTRLDNIQPTGAWNDILGGADDGIEHLYYYAFNLPLVADLVDTSPQVERKNGVTGYYLTETVRVPGEVDIYRAITFPIVRGARDLIYRVQTSNDGGSSWEDHLDIQPPYLDERYGYTAGFVGSRTLTDINESDGVSSLLELDDKIVSVVDNNYTATVTVRSDVPETSELMRVSLCLRGGA